jgi:hypothetical protein
LVVGDIVMLAEAENSDSTCRICVVEGVQPGIAGLV